MNTEDFVTFEQALALKKLGFCEEAIGKYVDCPNDPTLFNGMLYQSWNLEKDEILAPTLAQAQKWLRKEKKLSIEPFSSLKKGKYTFEIINVDTCYEYNSSKTLSYHFDSY